MIRIPHFFAALSELLYAALDAIGVNTWTVARRTDTFLRRETMKTVRFKLMGPNITAYHFGSQSEGTTTPGLQSDIDLLYSYDDVNIMFRLSDWKQGKENLLMVRDETTPAQHYLLQWYRSDVPEPETVPLKSRYKELDSRGRVFLSHRLVIDIFAGVFGKKHLRRGPSYTDNKDFDNVFAFVCNTLPPEIASWFNKCRPRYWPSTEVLEVARQCVCFLIPDGYHKSLNKHLEWRVTPNLIERKLMFSMNMVQRKCLVVLKMIKKQELVNYIDHEGCKITTFHFKTALFLLSLLREESTPAQHYLLQVYRSDVPEPETVLKIPRTMELDSQGRVFLSQRFVVDTASRMFGNNYRRSGPSNSDSEDFDFVFAFACKTLPPEIASWFHKLTPVYWPSSEVIEVARLYPCFLVPDGYHASPNNHLEWRITPNLIERELMFSLNIV